MDKLRILAIGTKESLEKSQGLKDDCHKFLYPFESITLKQHKHISHSQFETVDNIVRYFNRWQEGKICVIHPESRIMRPVPQEWIDDNLPVLFQKSDHIDKAYDFNNELPSTYVWQPLICSNTDFWWMKWWKDAMESMKHADVYPSSETMLAFALHFNSVKILKKTIKCNKEFKGEHEAVSSNLKNNVAVFKVYSDVIS